VVTGIVLGLALLFAGKAWFAYQERTAQNAANVYTAMMNALQTGDTLNVRDKADMLQADYTSTPCAALAALALARVKLEEGDLAAARGQLQWALDNGKSDFIRDVARLRLARVLLASGELEAASALVTQPASAQAFKALFTEVQGDIQHARGELAAAGDSYRQALVEMAADSRGRELLQLKYNATLAASAATEGSQ